MSASRTQASRNNPSGGTPRNNPPPPHPNPLRSSPYVPEIDAMSCWYGFATEGRSYEQVQAGAQEYVKIRIARVDDATGRVLEERPSDKKLELRGRDATEARINAGPWSHNKPVKMTYVGATQKVTRVEPWNGQLIPRKM